MKNCGKFATQIDLLKRAGRFTTKFTKTHEKDTARFRNSPSAGGRGGLRLPLSQDGVGVKRTNSHSTVGANCVRPSNGTAKTRRDDRPRSSAERHAPNNRAGMETRPYKTTDTSHLCRRGGACPCPQHTAEPPPPTATPPREGNKVKGAPHPSPLFQRGWHERSE